MNHVTIPNPSGILRCYQHANKRNSTNFCYAVEYDNKKAACMFEKLSVVCRLLLRYPYRFCFISRHADTTNAGSARIMKIAV